VTKKRYWYGIQLKEEALNQLKSLKNALGSLRKSPKARASRIRHRERIVKSDDNSLSGQGLRPITSIPTNQGLPAISNLVSLLSNPPVNMPVRQVPSTVRPPRSTSSRSAPPARSLFYPSHDILCSPSHIYVRVFIPLCKFTITTIANYIQPDLINRRLKVMLPLSAHDSLDFPIPQVPPSVMVACKDSNLDTSVKIHTPWSQKLPPNGIFFDILLPADVNPQGRQIE